MPMPGQFPLYGEHTTEKEKVANYPFTVEGLAAAAEARRREERPLPEMAPHSHTKFHEKADENIPYKD